jgi:ankyrin repeat protein
MIMIRNLLHHLALISASVMALSLFMAAPAQAQFGEGYQFLEAVEKDEMPKAEKLLANASQTLINTRKTDTGLGALHIAVARKDLEWMRFLLLKSAKPDIADAKGDTPLILAAQLKFIDGARMLLIVGAKVDATNNSGETALIRAVQMRDLAMVRLLIEKGADPDIVDNIAGQSARDYAAADRRMPALLAALDAPKKTAATAQP